MTEGVTMQALLTTLGTVFTQTISWIGVIGTTIVETPLLLLTTGFLCVGAAIGLFGRMLSKN